MDIALEGISEFLAEQPLAKGGVAMIVDEKDQLIAYPFQVKLRERPTHEAQSGLPVVSDLADPGLIQAYQNLNWTVSPGSCCGNVQRWTTTLYFVNDLTEEVELIVYAMEEMTDHFAQVSKRMYTMTGTVADMDRTVALMPVIRDQMREISGHVDAMGRGVRSMRDTTHGMDTRMDRLNAGVFDMSQRFRGLNGSVAGMGEDVNQMSRPIP